MKELYCYYNEELFHILPNIVAVEKCYIITNISIKKELNNNNNNKRKILFFINNKKNIEINFNIPKEHIFYIRGFYDGIQNYKNFNERHLNPFYNYWLSNLKTLSKEEIDEKLSQVSKNYKISLLVSLEEIEEIKKIYVEYKEKKEKEEKFIFSEIAESVSTLLEKIINGIKEILDEEHEEHGIE